MDSQGIAAVFELGTGHKEGRTEDPPLGKTSNQRQPAQYQDNEQHRHPSTSISSEGEVLPDWSPRKME